MGENTHLIPQEDSNDKLIEAISLVSSAIPGIGGPLSNILSGSITKRRIERITEFLNDLAGNFDHLKEDINEEYIKGDEFEEILEQTLLKAAEERNEEKRRMFRTYLINSMKIFDDGYDEKIRILRLMEQLQVAHILVIKAILKEPDPNFHGFSGSIGNTLIKRISSLSRDQIYDLANQLQDMRLTKLANLNTMMTASGAEDLRSGLTPFGAKVVKYILE